MKKLTIILSTIVLLSSFTVTQHIWNNDDAHSQLAFTVKHLGITDVTGTLNDFDVKVTSSKPDFSDAVFAMTAKIGSIDTRVDARDNHLKSGDFFDAQQFPTLDYRSTSIKKVSKNKYKLTGNLTMHGITKPVTMDLHYTGTTANPMSKTQTTGFQLTGTIKRSDFNIGGGFPEAMISDVVRIKADGEFVQ
ncbi:MAG: polyisoprenoid-binding protein [Sphingobacteriales bacterium]|nr:MAG: polyisoprenoid-binding protein [Sphingobacteriales bacterium]